MTTDKDTFHTVVKFLGVTLLLCAAGVIALGVLEKNIPDVLQNLAVGALTGIAGLLARTPTDKNPTPTPVTVVNQQQPVPVDPTPPAHEAEAVAPAGSRADRVRRARG